MRAKSINEAQNFERGIDPRDSMNIGNPEVRKINSSLKQIQDVISSGYAPEELDFPDLVENIDNLKGMILIVIKNYLKKNFGWDFVPLEGEEEVLSADIGKGYELRIQLSNSLKSYTFKIYTGRGHLTSYPSFSTIKSMDKKAKEIVKTLLK